MPRLAWSVEDTASVTTIVTAAIADADIPVTDGRATFGQAPPFVTCWQLDPEMLMAGLAEECWGLAHQRWQVSAHGRTQMEARWLAESITSYDWPAGWELVEIGPLVEDTTDAPTTWFYPITFVYRGMT